MGIRDAREMLEGRLKAEGFSEDFWEEFDAWLNAEELKIADTFRLDCRDIIKEKSELSLDSLPAGKVVGNIDGILKTTKKLINKYSEKPFFNILKRIKINLLIFLSRCFLWVIKHATAQPTCEHGTKDISTLARFKKSGSRYMGLISLGIIIGVILSFFLPDAIRNAADWLLEQIKGMLAHYK